MIVWVNMLCFKKKVYIYIYKIGYEWLQNSFYVTPSFMLAQSSGRVGLTWFSCYLKWRKEITKYQ